MTTRIDPDELLTAPEAAAVLEVPLPTMYDWIARGLIPTDESSGSILISPNDLAEVATIVLPYRKWLQRARPSRRRRRQKLPETI